MSVKNFLRIGVFYDGTFFIKAQNFFWGKKYGWLSFQEFHKLLENFIRTKEQGHVSYKVVYSAWFQGVHKESTAQENNLRLDRKRQIDLLHAGIDVYMAVETLQVGLDDKIDMAVLVTGDGDFVPLVRALMKNGVRVLVAYFEYEDATNKSFANERLINAANYSININSLENDREFKAEFKTIFRQSTDNKKAKDKASN